MKKLIISIVILTVIAAGSLTAFFIVKNKHDSEVQAESSLTNEYDMFGFEADAITNAHFKCPDGEYSAVIDENSVWHLSDSDDFVISSTYVQNVCTYMASLTAEKDYGEADDEKKALYGLDDPVEITLSDGTSDYTIYVGDADPTNSYYYVMASGKDKIYAISNIYGSVLSTTRLMLKDTNLIPYGDSDMESIEVIRDGSTAYKLIYDPDKASWSMPDEYPLLSVDTTAVDAMITVLTRVTVLQFYDENLEDLSEYGFDEPDAELIVKGLDGTQRHVIFSYYGNNDSITYGLFEDGQVATFNAGDVDFIEDMPVEFLSENVYNKVEYDVLGIDISAGDSSMILSIDSETGKYEADGKSFSDNTDAQTAYLNLYKSLNNIKIKSLDVSIKPTLSEPVLSITYNMRDGSEFKFDVCRGEDDDCYTFIDGKYTGAVVDYYAITGDNSPYSFLAELKRLLAL